MAKKDGELFDRLRDVGLRKQVAKTLSEISEGAGKKAHQTARSAATELRSLADEIERRLPTEAPAAPAAPVKPAAPAKRTAAPRCSLCAHNRGPRSCACSRRGSVAS